VTIFKLVSVVLFAAALRGETITGTILIKRKLTKSNITAPVSVYQRGVTVPLAKDGEAEAQATGDPLIAERRRVVVWIEGDGPLKPTNASLGQNGRRFVPDLVVIPAGSSVSFPNSDPIFHNVFSLSKVKSFDLGNYPKGQSRSVSFAKAGIVYVNCHLHPNMGATIVVTPNQWFTRPDDAGSFTISDLPPGNYSIVAWHKTAGYFRKTVQVLPGSGASVGFFIPLGQVTP